MEQTRRGASDLTDWSPWRPLPLAAPLTAPVLAELLDGGQSFRWNQLPGGIWQGSWAGHTARVRLADGADIRSAAAPSGHAGAPGSALVPADARASDLQWSSPSSRVRATETALETYFDADSDWREIADRLPWRSDPHLAKAIAAFPGLRILRQPFGETLLCFLCSAAKQIVQIKQIAAALSAPLGRLPTWPELQDLSEASLRACKLGFRARYVRQTAAFLARHPGWLEETEALPYAEAKERLRRLPGVGEKVADCVLLFGAGRLEAFPVDVWIIAALARRYGLTGWKPAQLAQFGRVHFGPCAGLAQQYLFAWERANRGAD